jgi:hypothetical protein
VTLVTLIQPFLLFNQEKGIKEERVRDAAPHVEPPTACQVSRLGGAIVTGTFASHPVAARMEGVGCQKLLRAVYTQRGIRLSPA